MKKDEIEQMLEEANKEYKVAMDELYRPSEDMVQMAVCLSVKDLLANYLKAFLLFRGIEIQKGLSTSQLLKICKAEDKDFSIINLSPVICRAESGEVKEMYCLTPGRVKNCFAAAESIRQLVIQKIMLT